MIDYSLRGSDGKHLLTKDVKTGWAPRSSLSWLLQHIMASAFRFNTTQYEDNSLALSTYFIYLFDGWSRGFATRNDIRATNEH